MKVVDTSINLAEIVEMARTGFGNVVKGVVDVGRKVMAIDAELHADEEALLLSDGARQSDLWGINLYPELKEDEWLEYDSMINIRPSEGNRSRHVDDPAIRAKIREIVSGLVKR